MMIATTMSLGRSLVAAPAAPKMQRAVLKAVRPAGRSVAVQAAKEFDFDEALMSAASKFEQLPQEKKIPVVGYGIAAAAAIITAEWFIHLPLFDFLLGFPIQLLGLLSLPYLGIRYFIDREDATRDAEMVLKKVTDQLPGLGK